MKTLDISASNYSFSLKDAMKEVYRASPYFLGKEVLGYSKFCDTQLDWSQFLSNVYNPENPKRAWALVLAPRQTLKSSFFTITQTIYLLLNNPDLTILIASETITNAEAFLFEIKEKLKSETFRSLYGNLISDQLDRADSLNLTTRKHYTKEANIETAGLGRAITGRHYDVIIADDIAGTQDRVSSAKRQVTLAFFNDIIDVLKKDVGYLLIVGTRWHKDDIYKHIKDRIAPDMENKGVGKFHILEKPAHDKITGKINYPNLLPENELKELRTVKQGKDGIDISTYMAQYELDPLSPDEQIFKNFYFENHEKLKFTRFVLWTDPALSEKSSACYSASVVLAEVLNEQYWLVLYASIKRRSPSQIKEDHNRIYRMIRDMYGIDGEAYMEDNGFQSLLANEAIEQSKEENDFVPTVGRTNTENKIARIRCMEPFISQGFIRFRNDWKTAPEGYALLIEQLQAFPQGLIDAVDALQSAFKQTRNQVSFRRL